MHILITGVAGFIGFNLAKSLLKNHKIFGIDNYDDYYSIELKKKRIQELKKKKNFFFKKIDINNLNSVQKFLKKKKIKIIYHLAAQAGVRYSYENPSKYINSNVIGFFNIIQIAKKNNISKIIYASSSSVYGDSKKFPLNEKNQISQKNIYAVSKMLNEKTAELYQSLTKIKFVGIRFFTIYGPWGRPDMFLFKMFKKFKNKETLHLNNKGNHLRDFTYIDDAVLVLERLLKKKFINHEIFNVCSNNPINILDVVNIFRKKYKLKVKFTTRHKADVLITHGNNKKVLKKLNIKKFSNFRKMFWSTYKWYDENKIFNY